MEAVILPPLEAVRRLARRLAAGAAPPVSPLACLHRLDAREVLVLEAPLHRHLRGAVALIEGRWVILLNAADAPARMRFTLAHEIGHLALGDGRADAVAGPPGAATRPPLEAAIRPPLEAAARPDRRRETWCDRFAEELLLPEPLLRAYWPALRSESAVARRFGVSRTVARIRLRRLGLLAGPARDARRDYSV